MLRGSRDNYESEGATVVVDCEDFVELNVFATLWRSAGS